MITVCRWREASAQGRTFMRKRTIAISAISAIGLAAASAAAVFPTAASAAVSYVVLGHSNYAAHQTNISNSTGTPLGLVAKTGHAPLWVNSNTRVARLNADLVDNLHASAFARSTGKTGVIVSSGVATCPKGTILTGGGGYTTEPLYYSGPEPTFDDRGNINGFVPNTWWAVTLDSGGSTVYSYAVCYSSTGAAIPGAGVVPHAAAASKALSKALSSSHR